MATSSYLPAKISSLALASSSSAFLASSSPSTARSRSAVVSVRARWRVGPTPTRCLFGLGVPELVVIAGVAALVFGPKQLPDIGRNIGKTVKSFQQAAKEFETELKKEPEEGSEVPPPSESLSGDGKKELEASDIKESA